MAPTRIVTLRDLDAVDITRRTPADHECPRCGDEAEIDAITGWRPNPAYPGNRWHNLPVTGPMGCPCCDGTGTTTLDHIRECTHCRNLIDNERLGALLREEL